MSVVVEFMRQSGEVVEVQVSYPWVPPTCSHCNELGHVSRNCLQLPPSSKSSDLPAKKAPNSAAASSKEKNKGPAQAPSESNVYAAANASSSSDAPPPVTADDQRSPLPKTPPPSNPPTILISNNLTAPSLTPLNPPSPKLFSPSKPPIAPLPLPLSLKPIPLPLSPPDTFYAPSLKRPRPDPNSLLLPSFSAQLSFFSSSAPPPSQALVLASTDLPLANPFSVLAPIGPLHHEETID